MDAITFWYLVGLGMAIAVTVSLIYILNTRESAERESVATELHKDWAKFMPKDRQKSERTRFGRSKPAHRRDGVKRKRASAGMEYARLSGRK